VVKNKKAIYKKIFVFCLFWGVVLNISSFGVDIYLAELQVFKGAEASSKTMVEKNAFSSLLTYEISRISSGELTYKGLKKFSPSTERVLKNEYVTSKIDALVVCHFEKIDYLIFGTLLINPETNNYSASLKLYSLEKNAIIHEIDLNKTAANEDEFIKELSPVIDKDMNKLLAAGVIVKPEVITTAVTKEIKETPPEEEKKAAEEKKPAENKVPDKNTTAAAVTPEAEKDLKKNEEKGKSLDEVLAKFIKKKEEEKEAAAEKDKKPTEKLLSVFTSLGYFIPLSGEWKPFIMPCVSIEEGIKYSLYLANTEGFDFVIRPAAYINYTFALNPDVSFLIHYHSLKFKGTVDAYFEFANFFAFYAGGGLFYRVDIIDYQTPTGIFRTDIPYALGSTVILGVEFYLNKEKTYSLGLVNVLDMTFFQELIIEYEILAQVSFKL
jgi:hypothetical protein